MRKPQIGTVVALAIALVVCAGTMYMTVTQLKPPDILLDWLALIFSGLTTGIISFFVVWGHFQNDAASKS